MIDLGRPQDALQLIAEVDGAPLGSSERARLALIRHLVEPAEPEPAAGRQTLVDVAEEARDGGDDRLAAEVLWVAASRCWWRDPGDVERERIIRALETAESPGMSELRVLSALAYVQPLQLGAAVRERALAEKVGQERPRRPPACWAAPPSLWARGMSRQTCWRPLWLDCARKAGWVPSLGYWACARQSPWLADWSVARPAADGGQALAEETRQPIWAATAEAAEALAAAVHGENETAERLASRAGEVGEALGGRTSRLWRGSRRGPLLSVPAGRMTPASSSNGCSSREPPSFHRSMRWWALADFAEAAARAGAVERVEPHVAALESQLTSPPSVLIRTVLGHARALLADETVAESRFKQALSADLSRWPFQRGRLLLAQGEWLRRRRHVAESRAPLRAARDCFDAVGARRWSERARQGAARRR